MTTVTIATFNVKNLIGPDQEYYRFETYTPEEYAWKKNWLADQILQLNADVICFQEIFDPEALWDVIEEVNARADGLNDDVIPDRSKSYHRKAIFRKLGFTPYPRDGMVFAPNANDGAPGQRRPGLAIVTRLPILGTPEVIQTLARPLDITFPGLGGGEMGSISVPRLSRPIQKVRIDAAGQPVTLFNIHFKSKLGEYLRPADGSLSPEADLLNYDPIGRAMGELRASTRRMAEAVVLRQAIVDTLEVNEPVMAMGDFNDSESSVVSAIVSGEKPFKNYAWMRRPDAKERSDRYSDAEDTVIRAAIERVQLTSAEKLFIRKSLKDMVFTSAFGGVYESIDQILLSRHFHPENPARLADLDYLAAFNDHLTDGSHPEAPYNKLASDHGQLVAHLTFPDAD